MTLEKLSTARCALPEIDVRHSKEVTILFTDLEDSTGLAAELDTSTYADLVLEHVGIVANVVDVHAGAIHQFTGDGVLALWTEQPDGPAHGLATVLALFKRFTSANACRRRTGRPWRRVRIGLHLGEAIIVSAAKDLQNLAIGPDVNFARRVEQAGRSRRAGDRDAVITASGVVLSAAGYAVGDDPTRLHDLRPRPFGGCAWQMLNGPAIPAPPLSDRLRPFHRAEVFNPAGIASYPLPSLADRIDGGVVVGTEAVREEVFQR